MTILDTTLNDVFKSTPMGAIDNSIGNVFYGINHRQQPSAVPINKDSFGLTFFTRPQLNLSTPNLRAERRFIPLLTKQEASIQRIIRCYLDPRLSNLGNGFDSNLSCPFVDPKNAFLPLLTNHLLSCTGWPDITLDTYVSKPGAYKEVYSQVDSVFDIYSAYDITATFRNMVSDPITSMFFVWALYQSLVFQGIMVPYPDFIVKNEIDYNTRIYRLVLDSNRKYIQKIGCTGAAYPYNVPFGSAMNHENDGPINLSNKDIQINFKALGACYQDDIIIHEFNKVVGIFNSDMKDNNTGTGPKSIMKKVPMESLNAFNNRGYPYINVNTYELEWYVSQEDYANVMAAFSRHENALK